MKTGFVWTRETEAERVAFCGAHLAKGFFRDKGFVIVPKLVRGGASEVVIPRLNYDQIQGFWEKLKEMEITLPMELDRELRIQLEDLVGEVEIDGVKLNRLEAEWKSKERQFWQFVWQVAPEAEKWIGEVEVRMTGYGAIASFTQLTGEQGQKLVVYVRSDVGVGHIAEGILSAVVCPSMEKLGIGWSEREAIVDLWMSQSKLKALFPDYVPTLADLNRVDKKIKNQSDEYVASLGVVFEDKKLKLEGEKILVGVQALNGKVTPNEEKVLKLLLQKGGEVVDYDQLADLLWPDGENFSLWAINRAMSRLRGKLCKSGLGNDWLRSVYGRGYVIEN